MTLTTCVDRFVRWSGESDQGPRMSSVQSLYGEFHAAQHPSVRATHDAASLRYRVLTRVIDVTISTLALIVLLPVLIVAFVAVAVTSRGPVIFRQQRMGRSNEVFEILKFRTMYQNSDDSRQREFNRAELSGELGEVIEYSLENDNRVTPVGGVLRRWSIDELPQLWNVIRGEMTLVGPRPSCVWEVELFDRRFDGRLLVRPGVTGLWQVVGRRTIDMRGMLELDLHYVANRSVLLDLEIMLRTIPAVGRGTGAA